MDEKELGQKLLYKFKNNLKYFIEDLHNDLILFSVESKLYRNEKIELNNFLYVTISDFFNCYQDFDADDFCENQTIIIYKTYEQYKNLKKNIKYIDNMLKNKQIIFDKNIYKVYKKLCNILNQIYDNSKNKKYKNNMINNLQDLKNIINQIKEIKL